jgi:hypothetical protein|tara:strand:+ start:375 stop:590 length:216 start_codon:yes stop_codon:yes gene_type:complete
MIRKVAIGNDYKSSMNYVVGQSVLRCYIIHLIKRTNDGDIEIFVKHENGEIFLWKSVSITMPFSVEYNINF